MKRKPTDKNLRVGQTLYYLAHPLSNSSRRYVVGAVRVMSDALPHPSPMGSGPYPRRYLAAHLARVPGDFTYSRRAVEAQAKAANKSMDAEVSRLKAALAAKVKP